MKKELVICIIIIVLIIIGNIITQKYTKKCVEEISSLLKNLEQIVISDNSSEKEETVEEAITTIDSRWHEFYSKLAFYIEHDELEKVETKISNLKGLIILNNYEEMSPQVEECIFLLEHIRDKHQLTAINIF